MKIHILKLYKFRLSIHFLFWNAALTKFNIFDFICDIAFPYKD